MPHETSGDQILLEVIDRHDAHQPIYQLPENEPNIPGFAAVALAEAGGDLILYQLIRMHYELVGQFVREKINHEEFSLWYQFVDDAMTKYGRLKRNHPRYQR